MKEQEPTGNRSPSFEHARPLAKDPKTVRRDILANARNPRSFRMVRVDDVFPFNSDAAFLFLGLRNKRTNTKSIQRRLRGTKTHSSGQDTLLLPPKHPPNERHERDQIPRNMSRRPSGQEVL